MKPNFIPKDKSDTDACELLRNTDFETAKPYAVELLEWVQDINWPVAASVAAYLSPNSVELADEITEILKGRDEVWKYWMIIHVLDNDFLDKYPKTLTAVLEQIAYSPTYSEWEEEVDEAAQYFLEFFDPGADDISVIHFEPIWNENTQADQQTAFLEMLESGLNDLEIITKFSIKGNKGKIKAQNSGALRMAKGALIRLYENLRAEMPNVSIGLRSRYE